MPLKKRSKKLYKQYQSVNKEMSLNLGKDIALALEKEFKKYVSIISKLLPKSTQDKNSLETMLETCISNLQEKEDKAWEIIDEVDYIFSQRESDLECVKSRFKYLYTYINNHSGGSLKHRKKNNLFN